MTCLTTLKNSGIAANGQNKRKIAKIAWNCSKIVVGIFSDF